MLDTYNTLNLGLHIVILFTILSLFFIFIVTQISKETLQHELDENIHKAVSEAYAKNGSKVKFITQNIPYDALDKIYEQPEKRMTVNNEWLKITIIIINVSLWLLLGLSYGLLRYKCGEEIDITHLLIENAIVFSAVGVVEYLFFKNVALKYAPIAPSFLSQQFVSSVKRNVTI